MSAYLSIAEIQTAAASVSADFESLLGSARVARRPTALQWQFARNLLRSLLVGRNDDFPCDRAKAAQYKFEVEDRFRRYYLSPGRPVRYVFLIMHHAEAIRSGACDEDYPTSNGYVLLVAPGGSEARPTRVSLDLLERRVADAVDAEWDVYRALPRLYLDPLADAFVVGAPAYNRIFHLASRHADRNWTIANEGNPSTRRLLQVRVIELDANRAKIRAREYWYLRWYSLTEGTYRQIEYREHNLQTYTFVRSDGQWLVEDNIYPPPRTSTPRRRRSDRASSAIE